MMKLSIIVPLYKSATWLPKCVESLVQQDLQADEYEIILVNDGSPDNSLEMAEEYAAKYANIVVLSQENKGTSGARNTGLRYASGEYVCFVDPDDYIQTNSLKALVDQMAEEQLDMLRFNYTMVDENYHILTQPAGELAMDYTPKVMSGSEFLAHRLGVTCYVWVYIYRLSIIKDNQIWCCEGDYFDDTPWLPQVLMKAKRVNTLDVKHYYYLQRSDSLVKSKTPKAVNAKINGQFFLIDLLKKQEAELEDEDVKKWYCMMLTHSVISLLSLIALYNYKNKKQLLSQLKSLDVYPLYPFRIETKNKRKASIINLSPSLFCTFVHLKNSI